jgi:hypothetical protein
MSARQQVVSFLLPGMTAAAPTSGSTVEKEKDRFAIFYSSARSFLLMLGTHVVFLIFWGPL